MKHRASHHPQGQQQLSLWAGLDVSKERFEAAIHLPHDPQRSPAKGFAMTLQGTALFLQWCDEVARCHAIDWPLRVVMEATGPYSLQMLGWLLSLRPETQPAIVNPAYIKQFGRSLAIRNKTDRTDAKVIARYGHERTPAGQEPQSESLAHLRALVRERRTVVQMLTAEKNRVSGPLHDKTVEKMRKQRMAVLCKQIKNLTTLMLEVASQDPQLHRDINLLKSIPGVGSIIAITIIAELGDLRRFANPRKLSAFAGLSPRKHESGKSVHRPTHICRMGNSAARTVLHLAARSLIGRTKYHLGRYYEQLLAAGKNKPAAVTAVSRKILVLMRAVLIRQTAYLDPTPSCGKLAECP